MCHAHRMVSSHTFQIPHCGVRTSPARRGGGCREKGVPRSQGERGAEVVTIRDRFASEIVLQIKNAGLYGECEKRSDDMENEWNACHNEDAEVAAMIDAAMSDDGDWMDVLDYDDEMIGDEL